jgi:prophage regulatory protein
MKLLRLNEVLNKTGLKRSTIYKHIQGGTFPPPVKLSPYISLWPEHEVDEVIRAWIAGMDREVLQNLVAELVEKRKTLTEKVAV